jgi:hypothetical protein
MGVKINRIILNGNNHDNYSLAVFMYTGNENPKIALDEAIEKYVGNNEYYEFVDDNMDNPWTRVISQEVSENFEVKELIVEGRKFDVYDLHNSPEIGVKYLTYVSGPDERPNPIMDIAKFEISKSRGYNSYIDSDISDLWSRLIIFGINQIPQEEFKNQKI